MCESRAGTQQHKAAVNVIARFLIPKKWAFLPAHQKRLWKRVRKRGGGGRCGHYSWQGAYQKDVRRQMLWNLTFCGLWPCLCAGFWLSRALYPLWNTSLVTCDIFCENGLGVLIVVNGSFPGWCLWFLCAVFTKSSAERGILRYNYWNWKN